jgi:hypothetical protein
MNLRQRNSRRISPAEQLSSKSKKARATATHALNHDGRALSRAPAVYILLGDIGATIARFALLANGDLGPVRSFEVAKFRKFSDVVAAFLKDDLCQTRVTRALFAIAGPVNGERSILTNSCWTVDVRELRKIFGLDVQIVNCQIAPNSDPPSRAQERPL